MVSPPKIKPFRELKPDGELVHNLHPGQSRLWASTARFPVFLASTQGGKTVIGPLWLQREMETNGPGDYMAVTATYPLLRLKMLPELQMLFVSQMKAFEWKAADRVFESHEQLNGAPAYRIILFSATNPESLESATALAAWCDEAGQHQFLRQSWEAVLRRLSLSQGRALITTTPYEYNWFKTEVYDRWVKGEPEYDVIQSHSLENPAFPREEYERAQRTLPSWKFNLFYKAQFEKPAGLIYDCFNEKDHCISRVTLNPDLPRFVGHDFGANNTAAVWFAYDDETNIFYAYREYHAGSLSNFAHAQKFKEYSKDERILKRVGGSHTEQDSRESYRAAGWPISEPRFPEVEAQIDAVYGLIQNSQLFVFNDLYRLIHELETYSRELDDDYETTDKIERKSKYHLLDATRYVLSDFGAERAIIRTAPIQKRWGTISLKDKKALKSAKRGSLR